MIKVLVAIDLWVRKVLTAFCAIALFLMVAFTVYTVFMRYVFEDPPVWGDLMTLFSNIWLVFIALSLTVREKEHIALNLLYSRLPLFWGFAVQQLWTGLICLLGLVICIYGWEVASTNPGKYWEMGYLPKKYPMMILPLTGALVFLGALVAIIEDVARYRKGEFHVAGGSGAG
ncbi:MAG: TRAP transporter small permease [Alphaproteobacteria bacterium]|nr:TRAP transporter small permease [Alphaproteobacteria bacterium]